MSHFLRSMVFVALALILGCGNKGEPGVQPGGVPPPGTVASTTPGGSPPPSSSPSTTATVPTVLGGALANVVLTPDEQQFLHDLTQVRVWWVKIDPVLFCIADPKYCVLPGTPYTSAIEILGFTFDESAQVYGGWRFNLFSTQPLATPSPQFPLMEEKDAWRFTVDSVKQNPTTGFFDLVLNYPAFAPNSLSPFPDIHNFSAGSFECCLDPQYPQLGYLQYFADVGAGPAPERLLTGGWVLTIDKTNSPLQFAELETMGIVLGFGSQMTDPPFQFVIERVYNIFTGIYEGDETITRVDTAGNRIELIKAHFSYGFTFSSGRYYLDLTYQSSLSTDSTGKVMAVDYLKNQANPCSNGTFFYTSSAIGFDCTDVRTGEPRIFKAR
ncbi:MAG: hypothetical protein HYW47_05355 [Deltaproteobacteria bacterium]|nr:hypothetical protein [Deltaproteobacteria bacterium]